MTTEFVGMTEKNWLTKNPPKNGLLQSSLDGESCSDTSRRPHMFFPKGNVTFRARPCCGCVRLDPAKTFNHADWWGAFSWLKASPSTASIPAVHQPSNPFIKPVIVLRYNWPVDYPFLCTAVQTQRCRIHLQAWSCRKINHEEPSGHF